jgi:hypothetical protein
MVRAGGDLHLSLLDLCFDNKKGGQLAALAGSPMCAGNQRRHLSAREVGVATAEPRRAALFGARARIPPKFSVVAFTVMSKVLQSIE